MRGREADVAREKGFVRERVAREEENKKGRRDGGGAEVEMARSTAGGYSRCFVQGANP